MISEWPRNRISTGNQNFANLLSGTERQNWNRRNRWNRNRNRSLLLKLSVIVQRQPCFTRGTIYRTGATLQSLFSLHTHRRSSVNFPVFWLVGGGGGQGNLAEMLVGILRYPCGPAKKMAHRRLQVSEHFSQGIRHSTKVFRANFVPQTCQPKLLCSLQA